MRITLLISGSLGFHLLKTLFPKNIIVSVFTDKNSSDIIQFSERNKINIFIGNPRNGKAEKTIKSIETDLLLSINYLFIIEKDLINWPKFYSINFHGSLLPKYRGRTPHVWAIINNEKETGVTAHLINEKCDDGEIIKQVRIPIEKVDTGGSILEKFNIQIPYLVEEVIQMAAKNRITSYKQDTNKATYFGRRTPDDGLINWGWQKERIMNWVRAQAYPYPGAFTYMKEEKVIIDKISYSDIGYNYNDTNGLIISTNPFITVKTPNGTVLLESIRNYNEVNDLLKLGEKFD